MTPEEIKSRDEKTIYIRPDGTKICLEDFLYRMFWMEDIEDARKFVTSIVEGGIIEWKNQFTEDEEKELLRNLLSKYPVSVTIT